MCETMLYCIHSVRELRVGVKKTKVGNDFSSDVGGWKHRGLFHFSMKRIVRFLWARKEKNEKDWGRAKKLPITAQVCSF